MKQHSIQDYFLIVYLIGWTVVLAGAYMFVITGFTPGKNDNTGLALIFAGLYLTALVGNAQLKAKIAVMERNMREG